MDTPLRPDASAATMSFVEHSPSTVIALNVRSATSRSARSSSAGVTAASVVRNASIVAMFGSIMPAPLAMPPTWNSPRSVSTRTAARRVAIEVHADEAGRRDQDLFGRAADERRRGVHRGARRLQSPDAGAGVGAAAVDHDGAHEAAAAGQLLPRDLHGRRLDLIRR